VTFATIQTSFAAGELSPSLFGRVDLSKFHVGLSTCRNAFVDYRGGAVNRAGTAYCGRCKQSGSASPPRDLPFQFSVSQGLVLEFGDLYMRIKSEGEYVLEPSFNVTGISQASPGVVLSPGHNYANGDWVVLTGVLGMTQINNLTFNAPFAYIVANSNTGAGTFTLTDLDGNAVNTVTFSAYVSGGTVARIFTLTTPYAASDLPSLKYTQSADVMTLTHNSYAPRDLTRLGATNWTLTPTTFGSAIAAPTGASAAPSNPTSTNPTTYQYVVTAVDAKTGEESVASNIATITNSVDIAATQGANTVTWTAVAGASAYNVYKAPAGVFGAGVPVGSLFGFAGTSLGTQFLDSNITADFTKTPPLHLNPFATGSIGAVTVTAGGTGFTQATVGTTITTSTGSGAVLTPIVLSGAVVAVIVQNGGQNYAPADTVAFTGGSGATATLTLGPASGTFPGTCAYFQERRVYADTANNPDTYFMSQPGAFTNMDAGTPPADSDAIVGTPWAQQVNGIQFMIPMPNGLVVLTGLGAWQLSGGVNQTAVTPADQVATPQAYNGCSPTVPPVQANYDILYVQQKGSIVRDLAFNFFVNIYTGTDMTVLSNHLFTGHQILQWAYAEEPYKVIWCIREDGIALSFTYLKEQDVYAWARSDTNGLFQGVCSISEAAINAVGSPLVNATYFIVKRYVNGQWVYYSERMDDRIYSILDDAWFVDSGLSLSRVEPNATLSVLSATGSQNIGALNIISGGTNYTAPTATIQDPTGTGAQVTFTVAGGIITGYTIVAAGQNYSAPQIVVQDATGSGAIIQAIVTNNVQFTASASVFAGTMSDGGKVLRMGGGIATITQAIDTRNVIANITQPIAQTIPNDPNNMPVPAVSGTWSIGTPTSIVSGLNHLNGMTVAILADGSVVANQVVQNGQITLPQPASAVIIGLPYTAQLQSLYLDVQGGSTVQGKRKNIQAVTVRVAASRGFQVGTNQVDASTTPTGATAPWTNLKAMKEIKQRSAQISAGSAIPLFTGDLRINLPGDWAKPGQVAIQQQNPLPLQVLALIPELTVGDSNG
jgi:hypothetical protein